MTGIHSTSARLPELAKGAPGLAVGGVVPGARALARGARPRGWPRVFWPSCPTRRGRGSGPDSAAGSRSAVGSPGGTAPYRHRACARGSGRRSAAGRIPRARWTCWCARPCRTRFRSLRRPESVGSLRSSVDLGAGNGWWAGFRRATWSKRRASSRARLGRRPPPRRRGRVELDDDVVDQVLRPPAAHLWRSRIDRAAPRSLPGEPERVEVASVAEYPALAVQIRRGPAEVWWARSISRIDWLARWPTCGGV